MAHRDPLPLRPEGSAKSSLRGDIQGMRAVAVLLVMLWHAGVSWLPGGYVGVDVFFVISGFLMTGILVRDLASPRGLSLPSFYARRARRLLPASLVTLVSVTILGWWLLPPTQRWGLLTDVASSAAFGMNWRMSHQAVDYLSATTGPPSPLQHFWSLGVEEQFYFVWPVLLLAAAVLARRLGAPPRRVIAVAMLLTLVLSLGYSIHETAVNPAQAYFVTWTRIWELAVGGLLALIASQLTNLPRRLAAAAGWAGLAAIAVAAVRFTSTTPFPGSAALLPVLGTALVVASGPAAGRLGPVMLLGVTPMRRIGDWSYSLYLWHWPLLVLVPVWLGHDLSTRGGLVVIAASFVPAYLSYRFVEEPARRARWSRGHRSALVGWGALAATVLGLAMIGGLLRPDVVTTDGSLRNALSVSNGSDIRQLGAGALAAKPLGDKTGAPHQDSSYYPSIEQIGDTTFGCISLYQDAKVVTCDDGSPSGKTRVVMAGDSHAVQWGRALKVIAEASDWHLTTIAKQYCPLARDISISSPYAKSCAQWQNSVTKQLLNDPPDLLITSQDDYRVLNSDGGLLSVADGFHELAKSQRALYRDLIAKGTKVVVLRNTPRFGSDVAACLSKNPDDITSCSVLRSRAVEGVGKAQLEAVKDLPGAKLVDLNDAICPTRRCAPVIGSVLVYQDANHTTTTYLESLAPRLAARLPGAADLR